MCFFSNDVKKWPLSPPLAAPFRFDDVSEVLPLAAFALPVAEAADGGRLLELLLLLLLFFCFGLLLTSALELDTCALLPPPLPEAAFAVFPAPALEDGSAAAAAAAADFFFFVFFDTTTPSSSSVFFFVVFFDFFIALPLVAIVLLGSASRNDNFTGADDAGSSFVSDTLVSPLC